MNQDSLKPLKSSDFVLDEGLEDDDEEMLAFEAARNGNSALTQGEELRNPGPSSFDNVENVERPGYVEPPVHPNVVVLNGMPCDANKVKMEKFLSGCGYLCSIRIVRRRDRKLAARVELDSEKAARLAICRSGKSFPDSNEFVTVGFAPADWQSFAKSVAAPPVHTADPLLALTPLAGNLSAVDFAAALPDKEEITAKLREATEEAKKLAESLENRARITGSEIDSKFRVVEQLEDASKRSKAALDEVDQKYKISNKFESALEASKQSMHGAVEGAKAVDMSYGVSQRLSEVSSKVTSASAVAAREVDENYRLTERARSMANSALESDRIGPAVKRAVSGMEGLWLSLTGLEGASTSTPARRIKYREPCGVEQGSSEPLALTSLEDEEAPEPER